MSSCKCSEITDYRNRIRNLDSAIWNLERCDERITGISDNLSSLASYSEQAYSAEKMKEFETAIKKLDDDMQSVKSDFQQSVVEKRTQLSVRLNEMVSEDRDYHEEQRRKQEEEAAARAAAAAAAKNAVKQ